MDELAVFIRGVNRTPGSVPAAGQKGLSEETQYNDVLGGMGEGVR
ncbi:hypothetical protein [Paenibacillus sp. EPM92]|nr:hypothetical protein [Paenibacillus sp. EPM92]